MVHDSAYFRRLAADARVAACVKDEGEGVEVAGHLALAYGALARRYAAADEPADGPVDDSPAMFRD